MLRCARPTRTGEQSCATSADTRSKFEPQTAANIWLKSPDCTQSLTRMLKWLPKMKTLEIVLKWLAGLPANRWMFFFGAVFCGAGGASHAYDIQIEAQFRLVFVLFGLFLILMGIVMARDRAIALAANSTARRHEAAEAEKHRIDADLEIRKHKIDAGLDPSEDKTVFRKSEDEGEKSNE